ncbi:MAG: thiol-disulfide oxidoreductase DCC family protein [Bacteroidia bacterium]
MSEPVVLFDGHCRLCHWSVQFLLRHDHKRLFRFATLDSDFASKLQLGKAQPDSVILWNNNRLYCESEAVLYMLRSLGGIWWLSQVFWLVPSLVRNALYRLIAKHRYRLFGKLDHCPLPSPDVTDRFLP